uniref:(northern house mosquito) hypothetical protein n=1 Tax=Culex pipiens TaxID=7175 RepID=A0A8D8EXJ4_CULPI
MCTAVRLSTCAFTNMMLSSFFSMPSSRAIMDLSVSGSKSVSFGSAKVLWIFWITEISSSSSSMSTSSMPASVRNFFTSIRISSEMLKLRMFDWTTLMPEASPFPGFFYPVFYATKQNSHSRTRQPQQTAETARFVLTVV